MDKKVSGDYLQTEPDDAVLKNAVLGIVSSAAMLLYRKRSAVAIDGKKLGTSAMKGALTGSAILIPTPLGGGIKISYARVAAG